MSNDTKIQTITNSIVNEPEYRKMCNIYANSQYEADELYQEFILAIMTYKNVNKLYQVYQNNQLLYYGCTILKNMSKSATSPFHKKIRQFSSNSLDISEFKSEEIMGYDSISFNELHEDTSHEIDLNDILMHVNKQYDKINIFLRKQEKKDPYFFYHKSLFEMYFYDNKSYRDIEALTQIKHTAVFHSIAKTTNLIQEELNIKSIST